MYSFQKGGMKIVTIFWRGTVHQIIFVKAEQDVIGISPKISEVEQTKLMEANGNGMAWIKRAPEAGKTSWMTEDNKRYAGYDNFKHIFMMMSSDYIDKCASEAAASQKKKLEGF